MSRPIMIASIVGARPQFIKAGTISRILQESNRLKEILIHTGQHYDENMSKVFFEELNIQEPKYNLEVGSEPHGRQTGLMMDRIEQVLIKEKPDLVLTYGDTNSTLAGALAAKKLHIQCAHVEAGLRSFNRRMSEEINRVICDHISDLLFCPSEAAVKNLENEGIKKGVHNVGDVMYDSVLYNLNLAERKSFILDRLKLVPGQYYLSTIHRAENTDFPERLKSIFRALKKLSQKIIIPLHPRTRKITDKTGLDITSPNLLIIDPVNYLDSLLLLKNAGVLLTDSGGMQKEAYFLKTPCITLRDETEWVETVEERCNLIVGADTEKIINACNYFESQPSFNFRKNIYGTGNAANQIVKIIADHD